MVELIEKFCTEFMNPGPDNKVGFTQSLLQQLDEIERALRLVPSHFIDLDPSARLQNEEAFDQFKELLRFYEIGPPKLQEDLCLLFESFSLYLLMRERFGEAADWYLKSEFEEHLEQVLKETTLFLSEI